MTIFKKNTHKISLLSYHFVTSLLVKIGAKFLDFEIVMPMIIILIAFLGKRGPRNTRFWWGTQIATMPSSHSSTSPQRHHCIRRSTIMPHLRARAIALRALTAATRRVRQIFLIVNFFHIISGDFTVLTEHNESFLAPFYSSRVDLMNYTKHATICHALSAHMTNAFMNEIWTTNAIYHG